MNSINIKELIGIVDKSSLTEFECKSGDFYIKMSKNSSNKENVQISDKAESAIIPEEISEPITIMPKEKTEIKDGNVVKSPIVGTFYQSSSPEKPPIVKIGDKVKEGDLLCIIEAMKIMNEIKSPYTGDIAEVMVSNEEMVEYGQPLFRII